MTTIAEPGPELEMAAHRLGATLECRVTDPGKAATRWHPVSYFRTLEEAERAAAGRQVHADRFGHCLTYRVAR